MTQPDPFYPDPPVPSPCINVCKMNEATGLCEGCWRTLNEIAIWGTASDPIKKEIWQSIHQRQSVVDSSKPGSATK